MKRTLAATAVILIALLLTGCAAFGGGNRQSDPGPGGPTSIDKSGGFAGEPVPGTDEGSSTDLKIPERDVITTGTVSITVKDPIKAAQDAATIAERAGGRIDSRTENPGTIDNTKNLGSDSITEYPWPDGGIAYPIPPIPSPSAYLTIRIPADSLDRTLIELKKLGTVNYVSLNASDVTQQTQDLDARINSLETSVDRLLDLMSQADNTTDLIAIEGVLSGRQSELESLQSQRDYLSDQIDYSTLNLELYGEGIVAPGSPDDFWTGIIAGWNALVSTLSGALVALGFVLPWLVALGLLGVIVFLIIWLSVRTRKAA